VTGTLSVQEMDDFNLAVAGGIWFGFWSIVLLLQHHHFVVILLSSESCEEQLSGGRESYGPL